MAVTSVTSEIGMQMVGENNVGLPVNTQGSNSDVDAEFFDFDHTSEDMINQYHALKKREANWKAYGFDSSLLRITDPWASRNLWFQQLTHSVRSVRQLNCPCLVKVPSPGTWPSILETIPEPLAVVCQSNALSWLLYKQQSSTNIIMALSVRLFRPGTSCSWLRDLPYVDLLDQHENMITAVPDALDVRPVRAYACFCSNNTFEGSGMFMGISDCDTYMMPLGKRRSKNRDELFEVTFHLPNHKQSRTLMVHVGCCSFV